MRLSLTQHADIPDSDLETPVGLFLRLVGDRQGILLESAAVDGRWGRFSLAATNFLLTARCRDGALVLDIADPRLSSLLEHSGKPFPQALRGLLQSLRLAPDPGHPLPPITRGLYGYLGYGLAGMFSPRLAGRLEPGQAEACLVLPESLVLFDHNYNRVTRLTTRLDGQPLSSLPPDPPAGPAGGAPLHPAPLATKSGYIAAVDRVKARLRRGEAIQVVLSAPFAAPPRESPFALYRRLRRINPSPYMFYMCLPDGALLGSSPETLVTCESGRLRLCPIAGTRPRGGDAAEDALFGDDLLQDPKEKAEHVMLVDLGRNDLGRIAKPGSVALERFMEVERFSHVMHLSSRIGAELAPGLDALDVIAAAFPAGTVSGAPKVRAMEIIAEEEKAPRGPYAGAVGWIGLDKEAVHLDLGIAIRGLWIRGGEARWQAGAGIVHDSAAENEWNECLAKAAVIRAIVLGGDAEPAVRPGAFTARAHTGE